MEHDLKLEQEAQDLINFGDFDDFWLKCYRNTALFLKCAFPDMFFRPFCEKHYEIFDMLDNGWTKFGLTVAFRGSGKTSLFRGWLVKQILFGDTRFVVMLGANEEQAIQQSTNLKSMLLDSPFIKHFFDSLKPEDKSTRDTKHFWRVKVPNANHSTYVVPKGAEQSIRGLNIVDGDIAIRPDIIFFDDLEKDLQAESPTRTERVKSRFMSSVKNLVDRGSKKYAPGEIKDWKIFGVGTMLGQNTLLSELMEKPFVKVVDFPLANDKMESMWPDYMSTEDIRKMKEEEFAPNHLDEFYREYLNKPMSTEDAMFKPEYFKTMDKKDHQRSKKWLGAVLVDPAKTGRENVKFHTAESACVAVKLDITVPEIHVVDVNHGFWHPDELYDNAIRMARVNNCHIIACEVSGLEEFISYPFKNAINMSGVDLPFMPIHATRGKPERVGQMVDFYRRGQIKHNRAVTEELELQLITFSNARQKKDIADALANIIKVLDEGDMYFEQAGVDINRIYDMIEEDPLPTFEDDDSPLDELDSLMDYNSVLPDNWWSR